MASVSAFINGFALDAALIVAIGAQNMFVLRQGLRGDHVGACVVFCALADALLVAAGVAGLGSVLTVVPGLTALLTLGGAGFLLVYGIGALRRATAPGILAASQGPASVSLGSTMTKVAAFTFLNPHVYLDTVLLMGSVGAAQPPTARIAFVAGATTASLAWFAALGYGARLLTPIFARPSAWRLLDGIVAGTMVILAVALLRRVFIDTA